MQNYSNSSKQQSKCLKSYQKNKKNKWKIIVNYAFKNSTYLHLDSIVEPAEEVAALIAQLRSVLKVGIIIIN